MIGAVTATVTIACAVATDELIAPPTPSSTWTPMIAAATDHPNARVDSSRPVRDDAVVGVDRKVSTARHTTGALSVAAEERGRCHEPDRQGA